MKSDNSLDNKTKIKDSDIHGKGVFADEDISKNESTLLGILKNQSYFISKIFRYINHSYTPNTEISKNKNSIYINTIKNIKKGEELTVNYDASDFLMSYSETKDLEFDDTYNIVKVKTNIPSLIYKIKHKNNEKIFK